jgi:Protein of unknown function (DUF3300)
MVRALSRLCCAVLSSRNRAFHGEKLIRQSLPSPRPSRKRVFRFPSGALRALATLLLICVPASLLDAQSYVPTPQELDQLLAPIALYPDALLAQITSASTNPQEILDVNEWLHSNPGLTGLALTNAAQAQGFDPAFIALVSFPQVLDMMARDIDDYAAIGAAFEANQATVMDSVQRLRADAYNAGALQSGPQQKVVLEPYNSGQIIVIQPANPQMVYVPVYNPGLVFGGGYGMATWITFGAGISLAVALANTHPWGWGRWGWNWRSRYAMYNRAMWRPRYNTYRPPRPIYRPGRPNFGNRPPVVAPRPRPGRPQIKPPVRPTRPVSGRPGGPSIQPVKPGPNGPGRPTIQPVKPGPNGPGRPTTQPGRPVGARPTHPYNGVRPAPVPARPRPSQPGQPNNGQPNKGQPNTGQPSTRPTAGNGGKTPPGNAPRPAPQPKPQQSRPQQSRPQPQPRPQKQPAPPPSGA